MIDLARKIIDCTLNDNRHLSVVYPGSDLDYNKVVIKSYTMLIPLRGSIIIDADRQYKILYPFSITPNIPYTTGQIIRQIVWNVLTDKAEENYIEVDEQMIMQSRYVTFRFALSKG